MPEIQSIKNWYSILNWEILPNFGSCHSNETTEFFNLDYLESSEIIKLQSNILETLKAETVSQIRLTGSPGLGKTTFLYFLYNKIKEGEQFDRHFFYIFHANKAKDEEHYEYLTQKEILRALEKYYDECGLLDEYNDIINQDTILKDTINLLRDFYKDNRSQFKKIFILILDDIDMLNDDLSFNIAMSIKTNLETNSLIKWLVIRPTTLQNYTLRTQKFFKEFFPKHYKFKENSLFEIVSKRIVSANGDGAKNPFSESACELIQKNFENNIRASLPFLKTVLEENPPKKLQDFTDESFLQNYIQKSITSTLLESDELPNIHAKEFISIPQYPLAFDILNTIGVTPIKLDIYSILYNIARYYRGPKFNEQGKIFQLRETQIDTCFSLLEENELIYQKSNAWFLKNKGDIIVNDISPDYYNNKCREYLKENRIKLNVKYWKALEVSINYTELAESKNEW